MIIVQGLIPIRPGCEDEALGAAARMAEASRSEPGCLSYEFYTSLSDPSRLLLLQEWDSVEALSEHYRTDHMQVFIGELRELVEGEIVTRRYSVQGSDGDEEAEAETLRAPIASGKNPIIH